MEARDGGVLFEDGDCFFVIDGVKVAKREAKTWVTLVPGWEVHDTEDGNIEVIHNKGH
jgi:hypothetical protein